MVEHKIPFCPSEPALCPVLALLAYIKLCKDLDIATYIDHESSIWLGTTAGKNDGKNRVMLCDDHEVGGADGNSNQNPVCNLER